jgi:hypothetical protein
VHAAPPVRVTLARSHGWVGFSAGVGGMAVANVVLWAGLRLGLEESVATWLSLAGGLFAAAGLAAWAWRSQHPAVLAWDGESWMWAAREGDVRVAIDLNHWMLLRFAAPPAGRCWIAASRRQARGDWSALRAALYSRRPANLPPDAPPA